MAKESNWKTVVLFCKRCWWTDTAEFHFLASREGIDKAFGRLHHKARPKCVGDLILGSCKRNVTKDETKDINETEDDD